MEQIINGILYSTEKATLIAQREGRHSQTTLDLDTDEIKLYKTAKGNFFVYRNLNWSLSSERGFITPVNIEQARKLYEELPRHEVGYKEAFGIDLEEA